MDEAALQLVRKMLETHTRALELFARAWCDTPEDVVQESLVRLAAEQPLPEQPIAWLYQAVRRRAMTAARAAARRRRHEAASARPTEWFEPSLDETIDARSAREALSELPIEQREVVVARLWGGLSFQEIGVLVGCSSSAAHRRYASGLSQLRDRLGVPCPNTNPSNPS